MMPTTYSSDAPSTISPPPTSLLDTDNPPLALMYLLESRASPSGLPLLPLHYSTFIFLIASLFMARAENVSSRARSSAVHAVFWASVRMF